VRTYWRPAGDTGSPRHTAGRMPATGQLIAIVATRIPVRVVEVSDLPFSDWGEPTMRAWHACGCPDPVTWDGRERMLLVEPARGATVADRFGVRLSPWWSGEQWKPLSDPFPACVDCGLCWPCPCDDRNHMAAAEMAEFDRLAGILPGCCWACGEPIVGRQRSITFPGENLLLPGGGEVVFHTAHSRKPGRGHGTCRDQAEAYEARWVVADCPEDRRMRLRCTGFQWRHYGYAECSEGGRCAGVNAHHAHVDHCTTRVTLSPEGYAISTYSAAMEAAPSEIRPPTNCGGRCCRGVAPATVVGERADPTGAES
jgi:hypothetical protein